MSLSQAGGAIPDADTFAYVGRDFESECFRLLSAGTWVNAANLGRVLLV